MFQKLFSSQYFSRFTGALGAGLATYYAPGPSQHSWQAASVVAATFLIYGATHAATTSATNQK